MSDPDTLRAVLLEREGEVAALRRVLDQAAKGAGGVVVVEGPAGIGKTRLLSAAQAHAEDLGMAVGRARGSSLEQDHAFGGVRQLLEPLVRGSEHVYAGAAAAAKGVLDASAPLNDAPGAVLHGLHWLTVALAEQTPLVLLCDDAHWFDSPSLRYLAYLAHRLEDLPIALVVGTRPPEPGPEGELLARFLTAQEVLLVEPQPLSSAAVADLVRAAEGRDDEAFCRSVTEASRGNPFMVGELLRASDLDASRLETDSAGAVVLRRLGHLSVEALAVARAVAVLGPDAHLQQVAALADLTVEQAGEVADRLVRSDVLSTDRPLAFFHPLVSTAVYNQLMPSERARLHRRAAALLDEQQAPVERLAAHLLLTDPSSDPWVVDVLSRAARAATGQGATDIAISLLRRALLEPPTAEARPGVVLELGVAEVFVTDPGALDHLPEAMDGLKEIPEARGMLGVSYALSLSLELRVHEAKAVLAELRADVADDPKLSEQMLTGAVLVGFTGPVMTPIMGAEIAELCASVPPGADASPNVLGVRAFAGAFGNEPVEQMADFAARSMRQIDLNDPALPMWFHLPIVALVMADHAEEAERAVEAGLVVARRLGAPNHTAVTLFCRAWVALRRGELADAEAAAHEALEVLSLHRLGFVIGGPVAILIEVLLERGDVAAAEALATEHDRGDLLGTALFDHFLLRALGRLKLAQGRPDEAQALFRKGLAITEANGCTSPAFIPWHAELARAGDPDAAATALERAEQCKSPRAKADALRALGKLEEAADLYATVPAPLQEAEARLAIGTADSLEKALELAARCGSTELEGRARRGLAALGAPTRRRAAVGPDSLTPSERRVAELAAAGKMNKEIAQELFLTVKTVETHMARTFQKLGVSSRAEVAPALSLV